MYGRVGKEQGKGEDKEDRMGKRSVRKESRRFTANKEEITGRKVQGKRYYIRDGLAR